MNDIGKKRNIQIAFCRFWVLICLFIVPTTNSFAGEHLFNYSLPGSMSLSKGGMISSFGGLIRVKVKGNFGIESGYLCVFSSEHKMSELINVENMCIYHTIPFGFSYSLKKFDFVLGPSFNFCGGAYMRIYRVYEKFNGGEGTSFLDDLVTTDTYKRMFCSLSCNVRYTFDDYYAIGATYGYGISNRFKNPEIQKPFYYFGFSFYLLLNDSLLK